VETLADAQTDARTAGTSTVGESVIYLRVREVAAMLGLSRSKTAEMVTTGQLPGTVRFGRAVRVHRATLMAHLDRLARGEAA